MRPQSVSGSPVGLAGHAILVVGREHKARVLRGVGNGDGRSANAGGWRGGGDWITAAGLPGARELHRSVLVLLVTRVGLGTTARGVFGASIFAAARHLRCRGEWETGRSAPRRGRRIETWRGGKVEVLGLFALRTGGHFAVPRSRSRARSTPRPIQALSNVSRYPRNRAVNSRALVGGRRSRAVGF